jgi:hypothetical protein
MLSNLLGTGQTGFGQATQNPLLSLAGLGNNQGGLFGTGATNPLTGLLTGGLNTNQGGLLGGATNQIAGLLSGGLRSTQNEQRLMQEKQQRNLLKKYLTMQTGDPIQSSLISSTIPGRGALDDFDVGLGTRSSILNELGLQGQPKGSLLGNLGGLSGLAGGNNSTLGNLSTLGSLANLASSKSSNPGLLSSLVSLAKQPNNNGNILSSLGGLGTGLFGNNASSGSGLLGSIQSGVNTLNTLSKVSNAVNSVKGLFA